MKIEDVYIWDINARWLGVTPYQLMENAGASVARVIEEKFGKNLKIAVFCGTGNNGGDGFVAARHLSYENDVTVFLIGEEVKIRSEEAKLNWNILKNLDFVKIKVLKDSSQIRELDLSEFDIIVDALLGAGTRGKPREPIKSAIEKINEYSGKVKIVSIDLPSGYPSEIRVKADFAVTFQWDKEEFKDFKRIIAKIGYPKELKYLVGPAHVKFAYKRKGEHKGQNGKLLIIGGSENYYGAPVLAASAAKHLVDLVFLLLPQNAARRVNDPDLIVREVDGLNFTPEHIKSALELVEKVDAIVIGPGIGVREETKEFVKGIIERVEKPIVVDADGLKIIAEFKDILKGKEIVLTPHAGEFKLLFGEKVPEDLVEKGKVVMRRAKEIGATILLKGKYDVISDGKVWLYNKTGNRGMTTGGTGDVLAGTVGAFLALGNKALKAAAAGAFLVGFAGDLVMEEKGEAFTARDVAEKIPIALKKIIEF
ncbi:bifunctional ADP-dependent NAD(P)H-hydrate dehydratase/NAD(P)H-hydrate epimerase [Pyrococcus horikoshii]|nr:bifunctional ADP-dependent NAD(P)H-hydrate dehydratase/NAD(P)H-hydrate epimerase [Pyrococcus horikoshii]HII61679.1 bifunctional ADP-dependent NAD(P)H-hydrate dehydratase/NAD(P)H-hydrate epimerase [Pyrococcus horikoshii]